MRIYLVLGLLVVGCSRSGHGGSATLHTRPPTGPACLIVQGARDQLTWGTVYDASYCEISYPDGDVPRTKGACTDVVIRSLRHAGYDLQELIHEDMKAHRSAYPRYSDDKVTDPNIDQRRVPNQRAFFKRHGLACTLKTDDPKAWQPGDIVEWKLWSGADHTGVLTDKLDADGFPYVIHNIGQGPEEEDVLRTWGWKIAGHFRYPAPKQKGRSRHVAA